MGRDFNFAELWRSTEPMTSFRDPRHSVLLQATIIGPKGAVDEARVRNISRGGIMLECRYRGQPGDRIDVSLRSYGDLTGSVAWVQRDRIGVMFDDPIELDDVLRRPASAHPDWTVPRPPARAWRPALHCA